MMSWKEGMLCLPDSEVELFFVGATVTVKGEEEGEENVKERESVGKEMRQREREKFWVVNLLIFCSVHSINIINQFIT